MPGSDSEDLGSGKEEAVLVKHRSVILPKTVVASPA